MAWNALNLRKSAFGFGQRNKRLAVAVDCIRPDVKVRLEIENRPANVAKREE